VGKQTLTVPLPAPRYWQTRHQQTRVITGSDADSYRISLHKQPPVMVISSAYISLRPKPLLLIIFERTVMFMRDGAKCKLRWGQAMILIGGETL
jgi:hypothetical protein